ncbi:MAG TPA: uracil-DNA glycosylase, partial [Thermoguttaceae bacterium]|nr:uracil-DNA glycosylase [Thermoguttaceae bacterium]
MAQEVPPKQLVRMVVQQLESWQRAGLTHLPKIRLESVSESSSSESPPEHPTESKSPAFQPALGEGTSSRQSAKPPGSVQEDRAAALARLAAQVARCRRCPELVQNRTKTVFGTGNPYAQLVFIGEAPGADEDRLGEPFVGAAGQLLTDMIEKGMGLRRAEVYIMNILRCRPPGNRTPIPEEAENCRPFLEKQLAIVQPRFICCLGACAAQNLLATTESISRLRGKVHSYQGIPVVCTYHPAYLLRTPTAKRQT